MKAQLTSFLSYGSALLMMGTLPLQAATKPNILLIMVDDMGWSDLGCFGSEIKTPHIDSLAEQGITFTDFHTSVSCSPTRSMLLSGTDNHLAGLGNMGELLSPEQKGKPGYEGHLNNRVVSLAEALKDGGYHTYMAGKWHLGHTLPHAPHARGFDRSFSMLNGGASYWDDKTGLAEVEAEVEYVIDDKRLDKLPKDFYATRNYTDFLMDAIRSNRGDGKPFLAYLAFTAPHDPMHAPEPWQSMYRDRYKDGYEALKAERTKATKNLGLIAADAPSPKRFNQLKAWDSLDKDQQALEARGMEVYAGMMTNTDYHIGRVISFLKDIGEYDNTIVMFLSDNGPNPWVSEDYPGNRDSKWFSQFDNSLENLGHPMSHYAYGMGFGAASAGPLDLFKMTVGEGGIRSPLIISGPQIKGGRKTQAFSYVWDIMPTILDYAGVEQPQKYKGAKVEPIRGKSLKSVLNGTSKVVYQNNEFIGGEMQNGKWMRQGNLKAVSVAAPYGSGTWHLYDVVSDPGETNDLSATQPDKLKELQEAWEKYAKEVGVVLMKP